MGEFIAMVFAVTASIGATTYKKTVTNFRCHQFITFICCRTFRLDLWRLSLRLLTNGKVFGIENVQHFGRAKGEKFRPGSKCAVYGQQNI